MNWRTCHLTAIAAATLLAAGCTPAPGTDSTTGQDTAGVVTDGITDTQLADVGAAEPLSDTAEVAPPPNATLPPLSGKLEPIEPGGPMVAVELKDAFEPMPARPAGSDPVPPEAEPLPEDFYVKVADVEAGIRAGMDIVWLDARDKLNYDFGHIPGAVNAPYFEVTDHMAALPRDRWIVSYCECPHHESGEAAMGLWKEGYRYVKVLEEGLGGWRDGLGMPVDKTE